MTLTQDDMKWIGACIRQEFDMPKEAWLVDSICKELIAKAKRFFLYELANEMQADYDFQKSKKSTIKEHL